jgi:hypothetical protein
MLWGKGRVWSRSICRDSTAYLQPQSIDLVAIPEDAAGDLDEMKSQVARNTVKWHCPEFGSEKERAVLE